MKTDSKETSQPDVGLLVTPTLVARATAFANTALHADTRELARQCVLNWAGVALMGSREPLSRILLAHALDGRAQALVH